MMKFSAFRSGLFLLLFSACAPPTPEEKLAGFIKESAHIEFREPFKIIRESKTCIQSSTELSISQQDVDQFFAFYKMEPDTAAYWPGSSCKDDPFYLWRQKNLAAAVYHVNGRGHWKAKEEHLTFIIDWSIYIHPESHKLWWISETDH